MTRPRILLIATGGTIAGVAADPSRPAHYQAGSLDAASLLAALPALAGIADIRMQHGPQSHPGLRLVGAGRALD